MREVFPEIEQGTPEWHQIRSGIPTTSEFSAMLASGKGGGESATRKSYLQRLAGEIITGRPSEGGFKGNKDTERGHVQEPEARRLYCFTRDVEVEQVGFIRNGRKGYSPDALVGSDGAIEIKSKASHLMVAEIERVLAKGTRTPPEFMAQVQGGMWIAEIEWVDMVIYCPGFDPIIHREYRDEAYIRRLIVAHGHFIEELDALVERIRNYRCAA